MEDLETMRTAKTLTILAFLGVGAGSVLVAGCGDNAQTCGPGTEPNEDGVCLPTGEGGPDAEPGPDSRLDPDAEIPDADTTPTISGTIAVTDVTIVDNVGALGSVRGGAIRMSFNDLTMPGHHGGNVIFSGGAGAPIGSCLIQEFNATHQPPVRLDAGPVTVGAPAAGANGLLKTVGPCTLQPLLGDPDPYACISHAATGATVGGGNIGSASLVAYTLVNPAVDFGTNTVGITSLARTGGTTVIVTTAAPHGLSGTGLPLGAQFVTISGAAVPTVGIVSTARTANVVTVVTAGHDLAVGSSVTIAGVTPAGATSFNGTFTVTSVTATDFTYAQTAAADTGTGGTTTVKSYNGRFPIAVTGASTFAYTQSGLNNSTTGGNALSPTNAIASSALNINGFSNTLFNSGASAFPIIQQLDSNTVVVLNIAPGVGVQATPSTAVSYTILNGFTPVPVAGANANFLGTGSVRIQKAANTVWPAIDFTVDVPGEAPTPVAITSLVRAGGVVTATAAGFSAGQRVTIAGSTATDSMNGTVTIQSATATTFTYLDAGADETATAPGTAQKPSFALDTVDNGIGAIATAARAANVVTITTEVAHGLEVGDSVTVAGVTEVGATDFSGTFTVVTAPPATPTVFTYAQTAANDTGTGGTTTTGNPSDLLTAFPTTTARNLNYSCDNNTAAVATDDTCGTDSTTTLKALIISGSATKRSLSGLLPFQMPTEISGSDTPWLEWQCAFLLNKSASMPAEAVQAIINWGPTRVEQQLLFVAGTLLDDGDVNVGGMRLLVGHALAGHTTFP